MTYYIIIETNDGFSVAECRRDSNPEEVARAAGGVLVDSGPYDTFQKAHDVLMTLPNPYQRSLGEP